MGLIELSVFSSIAVLFGWSSGFGVPSASASFSPRKMIGWLTKSECFFTILERVQRSV
jgi:hypothetical protein